MTSVLVTTPVEQAIPYNLHAIIASPFEVRNMVYRQERFPEELLPGDQFFVVEVDGDVGDLWKQTQWASTSDVVVSEEAWTHSVRSCSRGQFIVFCMACAEYSACGYSLTNHGPVNGARLLHTSRGDGTPVFRVELFIKHHGNSQALFSTCQAGDKEKGADEATVVEWRAPAQETAQEMYAGA